MSDSAAQSAGAPLRGVFVSNVPKGLSRDDISSTFSQFGEVKSVDYRFGRPFGFVNYVNADSVARAVAAAPLSVNGQDVGIEERRPREPREPREPRAPRERGAAGGASRGPAPDVSASVVAKGLNPETEDDALRAAFQRFGAISDLRNRSRRGYAFITFETATQAKAAAAAGTLSVAGAEAQVEMRKAREAAPAEAGAAAAGAGAGRRGRRGAGAADGAAAASPARKAAAAAAPAAPAPNSVYVKGFGEETSTDDVHAALSTFGTVARITRRKGRSFAFATFESEAAAKASVAAGSVAVGGATATIEAREPRARAPKPSAGAAAGGATGAGSGAEGRRSSRPAVLTPADCTLYVKNLPVAVTGEQVRSIFGAFGTVRHLAIQRSRGFCFVDFDSEASLQAALSASDSLRVLDKNPKVARRASQREGEEGDSSAPSLYVTSFPESATEGDFRRVFGQFGLVNNVTLYSARAHAFVDYENPETAEAALANLPGATFPIPGVTMELSRTSARQQTARARRRGGVRATN